MPPARMASSLRVPIPLTAFAATSRARTGIAPFKLRVAPAQAWKALEQVLADTTRVKIVGRNEQSLQAEFTSALLRFVDDVQFSLRPDARIIAVRSASRVGYYDFGANRSRVEKLRQQLRALGAIE